MTIPEITTFGIYLLAMLTIGIIFQRVTGNVSDLFCPFFFFVDINSFVFNFSKLKPLALILKPILFFDLHIAVLVLELISLRSHTYGFHGQAFDKGLS